MAKKIELTDEERVQLESVLYDLRFRLCNTVWVMSRDANIEALTNRVATARRNVLDDALGHLLRAELRIASLLGIEEKK